MKQVLFESSPAFLILCVLTGLGYAFLLYRTTHPWSKRLNWILFAFRATLAFLICFLLLGPIVRQLSNHYEKPLFVILRDNSLSIKQGTDSSTLNRLTRELSTVQELLLDKGYTVPIHDLDGNEVTALNYQRVSTDLTSALKKISNRFEGQNMAGVILVSDGIYNTGLSPLYASYNFPVYTLGIGDTSERTDLMVKNVAYNKLAYQGNQFPVRVDVLARGLANQNVEVSLLQRGTVLEKQTLNSGNKSLLTFDFTVLANETGIQKLDIQVNVKPDEYNKRNNRASLFIEVVQGKKKILLVSAAPHPDIKVLREVVDKNSNYEFLLHIPGISELPVSTLLPEQIDLAIFLQSPDLKGKTYDIFQRFAGSKTSLLLLLGQQSNLVALARQNMPIKFETIPRDYDEVTPAINSAFSNFSISPETATLVTEYPPASVPFAKVKIPLTATPILFQQVGSVTTDKPLLAVDVQDTRKIGVMLGEGFWRWRLNEFDRTENTLAFDELFGKLIQYLSTADDKRKFKSYPVQQEFSDAESVVFESQVYNDIFEAVYGNTIELELLDEGGRKTHYTYTINAGDSRYQVGGLQEGVYTYTAKTSVNGKMEQVKGQFAVVATQVELQNLSADFNLLKKLASNTGGKFYTASQLAALKKELENTQASSIIHTEETLRSLINQKWFFWLLLILVSAEWFLRKYHGSY